MNLSALTPQMWEVIRHWDYNTLINAAKMFEPLEEDYDY